MSKKNFKTARLFVVVFVMMIGLGVVIKPDDVYADNCFNSGNSINISDGGIEYVDSNIDESTAKYEVASGTATLTLSGYNGGSICLAIDSESSGISSVVFVLEGENTITINHTDNRSYSGLSLVNYNGLAIFRGSGSLNIINNSTVVSSYIDVFYFDSDLTTIEGGAIKIKNNSSLNCKSYLGVLELVGGDFYSECSIESDAFYQNKGNLTIKESGDEGACFSTAFAVFDGGTSTIECDNSPAIEIGFPAEFEAMIEQMTVKTEGSIRYIAFGGEGFRVPLHGAVLFNDGDITLKSNVAAAVISIISEGEEPSDARAFLDEKGEDYFIMFGENMAVNSAKPVVKSVIKNVNSGEGERGMILSTITDGSGDTDLTVDSEGRTVSVSDDVFKIAHITKTSVPASDGDEEEPAETEENPNTVDGKIVALAFGTLFAIIAEGVIIADLYRRMFGIKKEVEVAETEEKSTSEKA